LLHCSLKVLSDPQNFHPIDMLVTSTGTPQNPPMRQETTHSSLAAQGSAELFGIAHWLPITLCHLKK
jgi:hypothetical protein